MHLPFHRGAVLATSVYQVDLVPNSVKERENAINYQQQQLKNHFCLDLKRGYGFIVFQITRLRSCTRQHADSVLESVYVGKHFQKYAFNRHF